MSLVPALALLASSHLPAAAFAPDPSAGVEPQRIQWQHGETQGRHLSSEPWRRFARGVGRDWQARFDEGTKTPLRMWGRGIPMPTQSRDALSAALANLLEQHHELLGFARGELALRSANYSDTYDTWYVEFDTLRAGLPTYRGGISARIKHGKLVMLAVSTAPDAPVVGSRVIDGVVATAYAIGAGPAPGAVHTERTAEPMLLLRSEPHGLELRQTWMVRTRTEQPPGIWVSFVDAETGELLHVHNEVRFVNGTVTANHHQRSPDGSPLVNSPAPDAFVNSGVDSDLTDDNGNYTVTTTGSYTTDFHGDYVYVDDDSGGDALLTSGNANITWSNGTGGATQAEIDTYIFTHQVRDWAAAVEPSITSVSYGGGRLTAYVNINDVCNAYYDGYSINFFNPGSGCNDTGEIADVIYHEWGHGFHLVSLLAGTFDGSVSEGAGDTVAFFQTGDSLIAPYFLTNGGGIRDVGPNRVYPNDVVGEVHEDGLIFGGAMWDLWDVLVNDYGTVTGTTIAESIFAGLLKGGPDIPGSYYEALVADDDDGDLANGTPHQCQILDAFGRHGLGELIGGASFTTVHEPLSIEAEGLAAVVDVEVLAVAANCDALTPSTGTLHYRTDGGNWQTVSATVSASNVTASVPSQPLGTFVEYWVDGLDTDGNPWQAPFSGEYAPYSYFVGGVIEVSCEDFESGDGGYAHELVSGTLQDGADDWEWGAPQGQGGDPAAAYSGNNVWGNDLGNYGFNGLYQPDKVNRLWSPQIDTLWYTDLFLHYRRWLNIEDGYYDQAVITANGVPVWNNHDSTNPAGGEHHQDRQWVAHAVDLQGLADMTTVELGWEMHSDGGLEFSGWTLDDVCIYAPMTTDNTMAIVDFAVEDQGGPIGLSWTNPDFASLARVVVTRRPDAWPQSWEDGEIVVDLTAPTPGAAQSAVHANTDGSAGYYAAYGFDGDGWLSWTIEGWNASHAEPNEGGTTGQGTGTVGTDTTDTTTDTPGDTDGTDVDPGDDPFPEETDDKGDPVGGCNCDHSTGSSGALALGALGLLAARRRRS